MEVEATGEAAVTGGNRTLARDRATEDALRRAVEQAVGTLVASETEVRGSQLVRDRILTRSSGYVRGYRVTGQKEEAGAVLVTVRAKVATQALEDDLAAIGITLARKGKLLATWTRQLDQGARITLEASGVETLGQLNGLLALLRNEIRGVKDVQQRRFGGGTADLDATVQGGAQALASELEEKVVKGRRIEVTGLSANTVELRLVK